MPRKPLLIDLTDIDLDRPIADLEEIRRYNPQRFAMEQLTAIIYCDTKNYRCAGYKDVTEHEFWVSGHMPGMPLMPGVVMIEACAQMCSYFCQRYDLMGAEVIGFGGLQDVRFREPVFPGDRFVVMCEMTKLRPGAMVVCNFQGYVPSRDAIAVEGVLKGISLPVSALKQVNPNSAGTP